MNDLDRLRAFVANVGAFYVRDRSLERAQKKISAALEIGDPEPAVVASYFAEVRRYFAGFDREAAAQLVRVDRELANLYTRQYNLTAERAVAARRVEATQGVLHTLAELDAQ